MEVVQAKKVERARIKSEVDLHLDTARDLAKQTQSYDSKWEKVVRCQIACAEAVIAAIREKSGE